MPGLRYHNIVYYLKAVMAYLAENLCIPLLWEPKHVASAQDIQVILVLRHWKIIAAKKLHKFIQKLYIPEFLAIYKKYARAKIAFFRDA